MYRFSLHVTIKLLTFLSVHTAGNERYMFEGHRYRRISSV